MYVITLNKGTARTMTISQASKAVKNDNPFVIVTPFDKDRDEKDYKWVEIREILELKSNVANARWLPEKIMPIFEKLDAPALLSDRGRPTKFCAQALYRYEVFCNRAGNDYDAFYEAYQSKFPEKAENIVYGELVDEDAFKIPSGNGPSALAKFQEDVRDGSDDLEGRFQGLKQKALAVREKEQKLAKMEEKLWQNQVLAEQMGKYEQELDRKNKELEIKLKFQQMLEASMA